MKPSKHRLVCFLGAGLLSGIASVTADVQENPYQAIVDRNAFGLKPVPPPAETTVPIIPTQQATVELTGITSILSKKKALLEITEPGPGKTPKKPIMEEGDRIDSIEVISIDVEKSQVRIRNAGVESNLTFRVVKSSPTPGTAGAPPPALGATPATLGLSGNPGAAGPTIISPNAAGASSDRSGVTLIGGTSATTAQTGAASATTAYGAAAATTLGTSQPGLRNIPSRQIRTETAPPTPPLQKPLSREEVIIHQGVLQQYYKEKGYPPFPPAPFQAGGEEQ